MSDNLMEDIAYFKSCSEMYGNSYTPAFEQKLAYLKRYKPHIVCLCGSTRFMKSFFEAGWEYTLQGWVVLSVGVVTTNEADDDGGHAGEILGEHCKKMLDELHFRKIDMASEIFVLNVGGYIGESTANEIEYAKSKDKKVLYLEPLPSEESQMGSDGEATTLNEVHPGGK